MALGFEVIGLAKIYWVLYALFYDNRAITDLAQINWFFLSESALFLFKNKINGSPSKNLMLRYMSKGCPKFDEDSM
jgi:hypothetical protein